ncbi:MAG TPA: hypothetical protein VJQ06_02030 [Rhizomicrobium sp.]|nr:hypothetical protein [Rhizomicrobium sp.]
MADTAAALVIQLSADFKDFQKQIKKATGAFDAEGRKIEKRQAELKKRLSDWGMDFTGLKSMNKTIAGITAVGAAGGLAALVKGSLDAASAIGDTAVAAGVSVEKLQQLRFAAAQSGASFDVMDTALATLNKTFGEFVNTGAGRGAQTFKSLGIDKLISSGDIRDTEQLFDALVKKISAFGSEAQKSAYLASVFGKEAGPKLLQLVNEGAAGVARLEAQAVSLGVVLSTNTVRSAKEASDKLDALFSVMKAQGVAAVASLAPEIAHLAQQITNGLPDLIKWVERWAAYFGLIDLSPVQKLRQQIDEVNARLVSADKLKDSPLLNPLGLMSGNIDAHKAELLTKLATLRADLAKALTQEQAGAPKPTPAAGRGAPLQINDLAGQREAEQAAKAAEALRLRREQFLAGTVVDAKTAGAALIAAQNETNVQLLQGSSQYYAAVQKQIQDEHDAEVAVIQARADKQRAELDRQGKDWAGYADAVRNIDAALTADLGVAAERRKQKLYEAGPQALVDQAIRQGQEQIRTYEVETAAIGLTAGTLPRMTFLREADNRAKRDGITLSNEQRAALEAEADAVARAADKAEEAHKAIGRDIQVADEFRRGLEDLGATGVMHFDNLQDAALGFIETLAEMILRLYVLRPLIEDTFGDIGSPFGGGGGGGGFLSSIFSLFAKGGVMTPNGPRTLPRFAGGGVSRRAGIFGESGPEAAVPLPDGHRIPVELRLPTASGRATGGVTILQQFDLSGAVVTDELFARIERTADARADARIAQYDRSVMPARVRTLTRDPRRNY